MFLGGVHVPVVDLDVLYGMLVQTCNEKRALHREVVFVDVVLFEVCSDAFLPMLELVGGAGAAA